MKNIIDINLNDYNCFYLSEEQDPFVIQKYTEGGYVDLPENEYDLIQTNAGILVGYTFNSDTDSYQSHSYETTSGRKYIQLLTYSFLKDIFNNEQIGNYNFFVFLNSIPIKSPTLYTNAGTEWLDSNGNPFNRCDIDKYGGDGFYVSDNPYRIVKLRAVLDIPGTAHIAYFNTLDEENQNPNSQNNNTASITLSGIFKILLEWKTVAEAPFNNQELPAVKAKQFVEQLNIPEEIFDWVNENQIDMGVARFLQGETDNNPNVVENKETPAIIENFFLSRCLYKNILSIKNLHPRGSLLDEEILEKEKQHLNAEIYKMHLLGVLEDLSNETIEDYLSTLPDSIQKKSDIKILYFEYKDSGNL